MSLYFWLALLLLAVAFLLRVDFIFYIVYVFIGVFLWSRWYTPHAMRGIQIGRRYNKRAFLGENVVVTLTVYNRNRLPVHWAELVESIPPELRLGEPLQQAISLRGRDELELSYEVRGQQRGLYRLGPTRITLGDIFGLSEQRSGYLPVDFLTVYPRILPLTSLGLPSRLPFGTVASHQRLFEDPARPMGARPFRSGDSLRQINWKASAHTRQLLVRTYQPAISLETVILLNLHSGDYERRNRFHFVEWGIVTAASLATHLVNERQAVGLITNGVDPLRATTSEGETVFDETTGRLRLQQTGAGDARQLIPSAIPARNGRPHLMKVLEQLARIETGETISLNEFAAPACHSLSWGVTILLITPRGDEAVCYAVHQLVRAGFNPILIAVEPDFNFGQVRERARRLGFRAYNVRNPGDLDRWRQAHTAQGQRVAAL